VTDVQSEYAFIILFEVTIFVSQFFVLNMWKAQSVVLN